VLDEALGPIVHVSSIRRAPSDRKGGLQRGAPCHKLARPLVGESNPMSDSHYLVPFDDSFRVASAPTGPQGTPDPERYKKKLEKRVKQFSKLQRLLYADDRHSLLLIFQAMDAAGKDGTIRKVMSGVDPTGFQVYSFKQPSSEELDHDFLWRTAQRLPERGRIGVFNRSYYEEVLVVRVHPEYLPAQKLPREVSLDALWEERFASIREHEHHLWRNGTVVVKFWLNVSREEQIRRFVARIDEPEKNWKFASGDVQEAKHWKSYMTAYEQALRATSRPWAPWYAIPADDKDYMRMCVADVIVKTLEDLPLRFPQPDKADREKMLALRAELVEELGEE
jgi:PPK2 family polyphosphate:nucleotide phosphotransferase